jgi:hypothetical protein
MEEVRDELLRESLLQLVSYFSEQVRTGEMMRNQLIFLAHQFGARPKDLSKASDLTATRIHQLIKELKETEEPAALAGRLIGLGG